MKHHTFALVLLGCGSPFVIAQSPLPTTGASVVKAETVVSSDPVARGQDFQVAVVVHIADGYHMNSHHPSESYLIPTTLTAQPPAGITLTDTVYPDGHDQKFSFSPDKPLNVYDTAVTLRVRVAADKTLALGPLTLPLTLRFQACNNTACLPPVKVPVSAQLRIAAAGTVPSPVHPEIFSPTAHPEQR